MLMQLMFLATRTRTDILSAVCALATKCKEPHAADEVRLHRVIGYLAEYKDLELHSLGELVTHDVLKTTHLTKTAPIFTFSLPCNSVLTNGAYFAFLPP